MDVKKSLEGKTEEIVLINEYARTGYVFYGYASEVPEELLKRSVVSSTTYTNPKEYDKNTVYNIGICID